MSWGSQRRFLDEQRWTLVIRDITEARRMQQQLIRSENCRRWAGCLRHRPRIEQPLQAVVGYSGHTGTTTSGKTGERSGDHCGRRQRSPQRPADHHRRTPCGAKIIENLLLFVRQEIEKKPVDLAKVVSRRELLQYKLKAAHIQVDVDFPDPCPKAGKFPTDPTGVREPHEQRVRSP